MTKSNDEISVSFGIFDFECTFDEITSKVGLKPDKTLKKGDRTKLPNGKELDRLVEQNAWLIKITGNNNELLQSQLDVCMQEILAKLDPIADNIKELSRQYYTEISVYGYADGPGAGFNLKAAYISSIARLGAELDVDLYVISE